MRVIHPKIIEWLNWIVMLASILTITVISIETLSETNPISDSVVLNIQLGVCIIFLIDFSARMYASAAKIRFFFANLILLIVSVPYLNILTWWGVDISDETHIILRSIPLLRGMYGIVIIIGWVTRNKIYNLFFSYLITIVSVTYYTSIMFYSVEKAVNPMLENYWNALWWALMDVTTVGSTIHTVTVTGQVLAAMLAGAGMMLFPIFTAYITTLYSDRWKVQEAKELEEINPQEKAKNQQQ